MNDTMTADNAGRLDVAGAADDFRQSFVVAKNEIRKFVRGRKLLLYTALEAFVLAIIALVYAVWVDNPDGDRICDAYASYSRLLIILAAALFSAISISSEFEERTALILFVRPVRKVSIYLGKFMASVIVIFVYVTTYYAIGALVAIAIGGYVVGNFWVSMVLSYAYIVAAVGIALLFSSFFKKSSTATIMTFITLFMFISVITSTVSNGPYDTWYMLDTASDDIANSIEGEFEAYDSEIDNEVTTSVLPLRSAGVMCLWGIAGWIIGYSLFKRREF